MCQKPPNIPILRQIFAFTLPLALATSLMPPSQAAPGDLDPSLDGSGYITNSILGSDDGGTSLALQADGKAVIAGYAWNGANFDFALARFHTDGSPDETFDGDGVLTTTFGASDEAALAIAIQPDGKILAGGYANLGGINRFAIARYKTNGSLDTTFDGDGKVTTIVSSGSSIGTQLALQDDGKILLSGYVDISGNILFAIARYLPNGSLDPSFDGDGIATIDFPGITEQALSLTIQPDGKILLAGTNFNGSDYDFALARLTTNGSLDTTFDGDGKLTTPIGTSDDICRSVALQPDGKILAVGDADIGGNNNFAIARYNQDGSLDTTFDSDGKVSTDFASLYDLAYATAIQPDGKILAAGFAQNMGSQEFALARYNQNGSLDTTFDSDGKVTLSIGGNFDVISDVFIQPDGKILAAGYATIGGIIEFALARFEGDGAVAVIQTGHLAPGIESGAYFASFRNPIMNSFGLSAFYASLKSLPPAKKTALGKGIAGIWAHDFGVQLRPVARLGSPAPGTSGSFTVLGDPVIDNRANVAFLGRAGKVRGVWARMNGNLSLVTKAGDPAPGGGTFQNFFAVALPDKAGAIFLASVSGTPGGKKTGIYAVNSSNVLQDVIREGDTHPSNGKIIKKLAFLTQKNLTPGQTRNFSPTTGNLLYSAKFTDGTSGIYQAIIP